MLKNDLLSALDNLFPGVGKKGGQMQEDCIAFQNGYAYSYNGKVCVSVPLEMPVVGAVNAQMLRKLVDRMPADEIEVSTKGNDLTVKCGRTKGGIKVDAEIRMPIDDVEFPARDAYKPVAETFSADLQAASVVAAKVCPSKPTREGVHVMHDYIEAADPMQIMRISGGIGDVTIFPEEMRETGVLIPADSVKKLSSYTITGALVNSAKWLHMTASGGVTLSVRLMPLVYEQTSGLFNMDGVSFDPPVEFDQIVGRAKCLQQGAESKLIADVKISGADGALTMSVITTDGWVKEDASTTHRGDDINFRINYAALEVASKRAQHVLDKPRAVMFYGDTFMHLIAKCKE